MLTSPTNRIKHHFFVNVKASEVEEQVQELYSTLLSQNNLNLVDLGVDHRRERLSRLKVVIVLDNVETTQQVEKLLLGEILDPTKLFGHGSVIIITSRNRGVLNYAKAKTYNVEAFDFSESLELFSLHAFRQRYPSDNLMDLSLLALSYCKGNPLAIKVLGGALFDKDKEYWKSFFHGLEKNPKPEIHDILSSSYHSLKGEEQSLFMDVVCFPVDIARTILITYLATSYESAYSIVEDLISKSLLNLYNKRYELIVVHDLLKEMAWNIVKAEPNPSRLKNPDDVCKLFAIEESKRSWWEIFKAETKYVHRKNASSLQILDLRETPVRELPSAVHIVKQGGILLLCGKYITSFPRISKGLVFLRLCHTMITKMDVQDDDRSSELLPKFDELALVENSELVSLSSNIWDMVKYILLVEGSPLIESLPDISNPVNDLTELDNLRYLNLAISDSLESIPDNLHQLAKLELLSLSDCTKIQSLPQLLPPNLKFLYLGGCKSLQALPSNIGELNLQILEFDFCPQLDYELADKIAADFHSCALMCPRAEVLPSSVLYSGSELPQWCSSNGSGANCEMELPPPSTSANNELAKGIAFGVVFSSCGLVLICLKMQCDVIIEGTTVATFLSRKLVIHRGSRFYSSDYVLLWFDKNLLGETQKEEAVETPWYVKYAGCNLSFRVHAAPYSEVDVERVKKIKFKRPYLLHRTIPFAAESMYG
ncbi:Disease resistance-like protein DSC1 [Linum perenne]